MNYNPERTHLKLMLLRMLNIEFELLDTASQEDRKCIIERIKAIETKLIKL